MKNVIKSLLVPLLFAVCACSAAGAATVSLSSLDITSYVQGWGKLQKNKVVHWIKSMPKS